MINLFGYGKGHHYFIGKVLEDYETAEQGVLRALHEVNVEGTVLFRIDEPDAKQTWSQSGFLPHMTFLVDIGDQVPVIDSDIELSNEDNQDKALARIELNPLGRPEAFTEIDIGYFRVLLANCENRNSVFPWCSMLVSVVSSQKSILITVLDINI